MRKKKAFKLNVFTFLAGILALLYNIEFLKPFVMKIANAIGF